VVVEAVVAESGSGAGVLLRLCCSPTPACRSAVRC